MYCYGSLRAGILGTSVMAAMHLLRQILLSLESCSGDSAATTERGVLAAFVAAILFYRATQSIMHQALSIQAKTNYEY